MMSSNLSNQTEMLQEKTHIFITPEELHTMKNFLLLECSWGEADESSNYAWGHIPGAIHLDTERVEERSRWNLRTPAEFEALFHEYGITCDTTVVVYADTELDFADDRVAFAFLWAGVKNVCVLDGGMAEWERKGFPIDRSVHFPVRTDAAFGLPIPAHPEYIRSMNAVRDLLDHPHFHLISIRSLKEYRGIVSGYRYIDKAGEIKGAIWGRDPNQGDYTDGNRYHITLQTAEAYWGPISDGEEICFYCGTGWRASVPFLICLEAGMQNISIFDGGWYEWLMDEKNPVQLDGEVMTVVELPSTGRRSSE